MPSAPNNSGGNPTDVATNFLTTVSAYGFSVPMFFCPVRQTDEDTANAWFYKYGIPAKKSITTVAQLNQWFTDTKHGGRGGFGGGYAKILHDWWVPRIGAMGVQYPVPNGKNQSAPAGALPWPQKASDKSVYQQPIISDYAEGNGSTDPNSIPNNEAHFYNGTLSSINVGYADGHVETHNRIAIQWQFTGNGGAESYFY